MRQDYSRRAFPTGASMRNARRRGAMLAGRVCLIFFSLALAAFAPARAQTVSLDDLLSAVVHIKTAINPDGRSVANLGRNRDGTGIVIDNDGLILTIGYLMVEAQSAEVITSDGRAVPANVVGYDHESGFGLLRAIVPLKVHPLALGHSAERQGEGSGRHPGPRRPRPGGAGRGRVPPRLRGRLGISARRRDLYLAAVPGLERRRAGRPVRQAGRRRLADPQGCERAGRRPRQHVRADRPPRPDHGRPDRRRPRRRPRQAVARRRHPGARRPPGRRRGRRPAARPRRPASATATSSRRSAAPPPRTWKTSIARSTRRAPPA